MMNACPRWSLLAVPLLAALGCSDPVPLPAQGAITISVQKPNTVVNQMDCPVPGKTYQVGAPDPATTTSIGKVVVDGDKGANISCSVHSAAGGTFTFSGSFHGVSSESDPITVVFSDGLINADKTGTATVSVYTPQLASNFNSAVGACTVNVIQNQVKNGSIWASYFCPSITSSPSGLCSIGMSSAIVFENCDGS